ncbi:MAG: DHH family phosphoesterase [Thermodesulfovibrionales bacterium]
MKTPKQLVAAFRQETTFLIATHINPDGDAIGSSLALAEALESMGKKVFVYDRDPVPKMYHFLSGHQRFRTDIKKIMRTDPVLVLLDCNAPERAALENYRFRKSVVIDHHETEAGFGDIAWVEKHAAATGLLVQSVIRSLRVRLTKGMADNLYTAISVDTGTFRFSNTTAAVLRASAALVEAGADPNLIATQLYETWDFKKFRLFLLAMSTLEKKDGLVITQVTREMFRKTGTSAEDTENFSNFPRKIDSIRLAAMFRELGRDEWKASLRAKGDINVAQIAEMFGGGGHHNAAGYTIKADILTAKKALVTASRKVLSSKRS